MAEPRVSPLRPHPAWGAKLAAARRLGYSAAMLLRLPASSFDALIFDCDGTLVDSMPLHHRAWRAAFAENGARFDFDWPLFLSRAGKGLHETVHELNEQFGEALDVERVVAAQHASYERWLSEVRAIEPVVELARRYGATHPMAVASGGQRELVRRTLEVIGVAALFSHVVCRADVRFGKPHPESFLRCAELLGVEPRRCVVFEDAEPGIAAAIAAGMAWVAVDGSGRCGEAR